MLSETQIAFSFYINVIAGCLGQYLNVVRDLIFIWFISRLTLKAYKSISLLGFEGALDSWFKDLKQAATKFLRSSLPGVDSTIKKEVAKQVKCIQEKMVAHYPGRSGSLVALPKRGLSDDELRSELHRYKDIEPEDWKYGKISGAIYNFDPKLTALVTEAYGIFLSAN
ncbi:hypothetical protein HK096_002944, partial [Nowakowskiella sp. JEL0078]